MTPERTVVGLDFRGGRCFLARVQHELGRPQVRTLARLEAGQLGGYERLAGADCVVAYPDSRTLVRRVYTYPECEQREDDIRFELDQSLLDPLDSFACETIPTAESDLQLVLVTRQEQLADYRQQIIRQVGRAVDGFQMRAAALARGYLGFGRLADEGLVALAEFYADGVSLALLRNGAVADLAALTASTDGDDQRAVEFSTLLHYRLSLQRSYGKSTELKRLYAIGLLPDSPAVSKLRLFFGLPVEHPQLNLGYFPNANPDEPQTNLLNYLVPLGLALN